MTRGGGIQWVLPSLDADYRRECVAGMSPAVRERTLQIDNRVVNRGCAASWNLGRKRALNESADWLVILSESMRFGDAGGQDFEEELYAHEGLPMVLGACDGTCTEVYETGQGFCRRGYGWHMAAISRETLQTVGAWDEIFYPIYFEDTDYQRRMQLAGTPGGMIVPGIDAHLAACEHSVTAGFIAAGWAITLPFYEAKWGGRPGEETYDRPYDNPALALSTVTSR